LQAGHSKSLKTSIRMGALGLPSVLPGSASDEAARQGNSAASARAKSFIFLFYVPAAPTATPNYPPQPPRPDSCFNRVNQGDFMFIKLLLTAMIAATLAFAQGGGGMGGGDTGGMGGGGTGGAGGRGGGGIADDTGGMPRAARQTPFEIFADRLKLNKDQKAQAQTVLTDAMKESTPVRQQLVQSKLDIAKAILGGASDDDLKKTTDAYAALVAQVTGVEAKAFAKVYATLKPNQQGKAASAFELMGAMFNAPAGGGGRAGGRRERN
jgi:hypothetical protein